MSHTTYAALWQSITPLYEPREAQSVVRLVLEERFAMSLTDIVCGGVESLADADCGQLQAIMRRLQTGEPVQYVLGRAWFCGRPFHVAPGVLIPRPETEQLCRMIADDSNGAGSTAEASPNKHILDIGTGSGCIATTLALDIPKAEVSAVDISPEALAIARSNARSLGAKVKFIECDILQQDTSEDNMPSCLPSCLDVIVSNPPYIALSERESMEANVLGHEPSLALFVSDDDPLVFYRAIGRYALRALAPGGSLYYEINPLFARELKDMLHGLGLQHVDIVDDGFGKQRFAKAIK